MVITLFSFYGNTMTTERTTPRMCATVYMELNGVSYNEKGYGGNIKVECITSTEK